MRLLIKRIDPTLPLPQYQTKGSVGFDLYSRIDMEIKPQELGLVPLNIVVQIPAEYMLLVVPRSSTPKKKGLLIPHGIGVIDQDYCGEADELLFQAFNFTHETVSIKRGERIAQGLLVKIATPELTETSTVTQTSRGGVGSTG